MPAIDRVLAIMAQRAKLFGLNQPTRHRIEVLTEDVVDAAIRRLEAQLDETAHRLQG